MRPRNVNSSLQAYKLAACKLASLQLASLQACRCKLPSLHLAACKFARLQLASWQACSLQAFKLAACKLASLQQASTQASNEQAVFQGSNGAVQVERTACGYASCAHDVFRLSKTCCTSCNLSLALAQNLDVAACAGWQHRDFAQVQVTSCMMCNMSCCV